MTIDEVLRRREDQHLEFKSARSLAEPENVARELVGMLNAEGGTIWIGIEDGENGAAGPVDPVPNAERAKGRLLDYLLETIEPTPSSDEFAIEVHQYGVDDRGLLEIRVHPPSKDSPRSPAAFVRKGGKHFVRRIDRRNHPMSREEVFGQRANTGQDEEVENAIRKLAEARTAFRDTGRDGLWIGLQPAPELDLQLLQEHERLARIAADPPATGNRRAGVHFAMTNRSVQRRHQQLEWGWWSEVSKDFVSRVRVKENGGMEFTASLTVLLDAVGWLNAIEGKPEKEFDSLALLELPISAFRIAREVYGADVTPTDRVVADLALFGVQGWGLRKGSPGTAYYLGAAGRSMERLAETDLISKPIVFSFRRIDEEPDRCGFRLVQRIYWSFGFREIDIPRQFDQESGKLLLPE
jgi:hypothetical protein